MKIKKDFFIIGTDTDVGKTYVSSLLYSALLKEDYFYFKPVQSGCYYAEKNIKKNGENFLIAPDVKSVCDFSNLEYNKDMVCYALKEEVSPHLAAQKENIEISLDKIKKYYTELKKKYSSIIVEGAGGLHVPLLRTDDKKLYIFDMIKALNLPVVLVCSTKVGSINHSMLTINTLKNMGIKIQGLVFNNYKNNFYEDDNIKVILEDSCIKNYIVIKNKQKNLTETDVEKLLGGDSDV